MYTNNFKKTLESRAGIIEQTINKAELQLAKSPDGRLRIQHRGNSVSYFHVTKYGSVNGELIKTSEMDMVRALAQKAYLESLLRSAKTEKKYWSELMNHYPETPIENIYSNLSDDRKHLVKPLAVSDDEYADWWVSQPYKKKPFSETDPNFVTLKGDRVRSKSEQIIADRLFINKIPYRYECPVMVGNKVFHPDFTVLKKSERKVIYWEHCGAMDKKGYSDYAVDRFNRFAKNGILIGTNLIATFETMDVPLDTETVDKLINAHFK